MNKSFRELDRLKGIAPLPPADGEEFPLPAWYRSIIDVPINELTPLDLAKACQQKIHSEEIVPLVLEILKVDPLAGEYYEGHLCAALLSIDADFWKTNPGLLSQVHGVLNEHRISLEPELADDIATFRKKLV